MANALEIAIKARDQASEVFGKVKDSGTNAAQTLEANWDKMAIAGALAGAALEGFARSQAESNEKTQRLAASLGIAEQEIRDLAIATSDVTFPLDEVLDLMETGRKRGLESAEALQQYAQFWDLVGDATGESATALAESDAALRTMGIAVGEEEKAIAAFGAITEHTTGDIGGFLRILERVGPELNDMGIDIDESAALLMILEKEFGLSGTAARRELMEAVNAADGSLEDMLETLGVSEDMLGDYTDQVKGSSDVLERNAEIHASTYTPLQKLQHRVSELTYGFGNYAQQAANLAPLVMALGPAVKAVSVAKGLLAKSTGIATIATKAFGVAMAIVTSPIFLVVAAIAAAIAIGWLLYKNWDEVVAFVKNIWEVFSGWFTSMIQERFIGPFHLIMDTLGRVKDAFGTAFNAARDAVRGPVNAIIGFQNALISGFERMINAIGRAINSVPSVNIPSWVPVIGGKSFGIPNIPTISLPRIPTMDTGGLVQGPGLFHVGAGVKEIVRDPGGAGVTIGNLVINANDAEGGRRAAQAFTRELHRRGYRLEGVLV